MKDHIVTLEEGERQVVLLALAKLSIERPGWLDMIERIALKMDNRTAQGEPELLYEFRRIHDPGGWTGMAQQTLSSEAKKELARCTVKGLYASFDVEMLEKILAVGQTYDGNREEVLYMNEALAAEIERRKAD